MRVIIDGNEYVPKGEIPPLTDNRLDAALRELTSIQRFPECQNKHRAWAWDALNALAPELAALPPEIAYERMHPESADGYKTPTLAGAEGSIRLVVDIVGSSHQDVWRKLNSILCEALEGRRERQSDWPTYISTPDGKIETVNAAGKAPQ